MLTITVYVDRRESSGDVEIDKPINEFIRCFYQFVSLISPTDYEHPERPFFQKFETFGLGQTNWAEILGIWGIFGQTISTILAL